MKCVKIFAVLVLVLSVMGSVARAETPIAPAPAAIAPTTVPSATTNGPASAVIKNFYAQLQTVMKQGDQLGYAGRFKKLDPIIKSTYDLPTMTRFAVGLVWSKATPDEQKQLISAFSDFSIASYASRFTKYNGEEFNVLGEKPVDGGVLVETSLKPKDTDAVKLSYLMKADEKGSYRIVDVFLDGSISELATRRAEFSSIVAHDGIGALVNSLGEKSKQMGPS